MKVCNITPQPQFGGHVSTASYALGFFFSLVLTILAFLIVWKKLLSGSTLAVTLFVLAILQVWAQLVFYFNLGKEATPRYSFWSFYLMLTLLLIIVIGTLIIMANLDYRMM